MKLIFKKQEYVNVINLAAITSYFARAITDINAFLILGGVLGWVVFLYQFLDRLRLPYVAAISLFIVLASYCFTILNNGLSHGKLFIPLYVACLGIAWRIATHGINYRFCWIIFYGSIAYFVISLFVFNSTLHSLFAYSRNHISVYFINATALLYIGALTSGRQIGLLPVVLIFFVSIVSIGIGGIISSLSFLFLLACYKSSDSSFAYKIILFFTFAAFALGLLIMWDDIIGYVATSLYFSGDILIKLHKISELGGRYEIWSEYFEKLDITRLLVGSSLSESFYGFQNVHSSYFLLHQRMGFLGVILMCLFFYALVKMYHVNFVYFSCFFVLLLRGLSDTTFLAGSSFDFLFLFFCLFAFISIKNKSNLGYRQLKPSTDSH